MDRRGIAIFTIVEVVALALWLTLARSAPGGYLAAGVLFAGLVVEHLIAFNVTTRRSPFAWSDLARGTRRQPLRDILVFSAIETGIWALWLSLQALGPLATAILFVALLIEHNLSDNVFKGRPLFAGVITNGKTAGFSAVETFGATVWLQQVGAGHLAAAVGVLFVASYIEHSMAVDLGRRTDR